MIIWHKIGGFLVVGYLLMTRSFAYLGVPSLKIFVGEIVLAAFLLLKPRVALGTLAASLLRPSPLNGLGLALLPFLAYGVWQVGRGVSGGSPVLYTLKFLAFNYYAMYLFMGIWIGMQADDFLPKLVRVIAWGNAIYGLIYLLMLRSLSIMHPGAAVSLFGQPVGSAIAIVGLLCIQRSLATNLPLLSLNSIVILGMQIRGEWLALSVGLLVWGLLTRRLGRVVAIGLIGLAVLGVIELAGIKIAGRVNSISLGATLSHVIAPIDKDLAKRFGGDAETSAGTIAWRQLWWDQIWSSVHSTPRLAVFGHGYGFDLFSLAPPSVRLGQAAEIRTPHNGFYYALGYTGWVGVLLFGLLQFAIVRLLWRAYRGHGAVVGLVWWAMGISTGCFGNYFETPFGAIPFYLLVGMSMAPALKGSEVDARSPRAQLLSVARR